MRLLHVGGELVDELASDKAPSKFFKLFDTDGDGLLSFPEFIFFMTLLSLPEVGRRCKLDPGLKAARFQIFIVKWT